jgi:hypothetical protein
MTQDTSSPSQENADAVSAVFRLPEESLAARNKPNLLAALSQHGVQTATVTYAGSGDSGGVEEVDYEIAEGAVFDGSATTKVFACQSHFESGEWHDFFFEQELCFDQALRDFAEEVLELVHGGWENGEGGSGSIVFDGVSATVRIEHSSYFTDSDYTETAL